MATPATEAEARDVAEAARETEWTYPSFAAELFLGRFRPELIHPHPPIDDAAEEARAAPFLARLRDLLVRLDSDAIDRTGELPEDVVQELRDIGAFGIKIPREFGGLGLSHLTYVRAMQLVASKDGNLIALLSASQSIGLPQPLELFGTPDQQRRFFPRLAKGAISAFALTEVNAGSDPANMTTSAVLSPDGTHWILNGEKLWCTNGTRCELMVVMARTPDVVVKGKPRKQITAFIVETNAPGVEILHRCRFMGLKAIENGWLRFTNVQVPVENLLWGEGKGLKLALTTLNTGRLTIPASSAGAAKAMLEIVREWANERVQWGQPIGKHEAIAQKIGHMAATTFAMESVAELATALHQRGGADIRIEAAIAKLWNTEAGWRIIDDTMQIRGGRGYETADSLRARGEKPIPVERAMRDFRINLIFEGSSEIMRLFIAREAVDPHFRRAFSIVDPKSTLAERLEGLKQSAPFYARWYPARLVNAERLKSHAEFGRLAPFAQYVGITANRLGRAIFHAMLRYGPSLERRQLVLFRAVDIGAELFAMSAAISRATHLDQRGQREALLLADVFCREARDRVEHLFETLHNPTDEAVTLVAGQVLAGRHKWLEDGIIGLHAADELERAIRDHRDSGDRELVLGVG